MKKTAPTRICIYPKDIQLITGKSETAARDLLQRIREHYGKAEHQFITVEEFCNYTGLKSEQVQPFLIS